MYLASVFLFIHHSSFSNWDTTTSCSWDFWCTNGIYSPPNVMVLIQLKVFKKGDQFVFYWSRDGGELPGWGYLVIYFLAGAEAYTMGWRYEEQRGSGPLKRPVSWNHCNRQACHWHSALPARGGIIRWEKTGVIRILSSEGTSNLSSNEYNTYLVNALPFIMTSKQLCSVCA